MRGLSIAAGLAGVCILLSSSHAEYIRIASDGTITNVPSTASLRVLAGTPRKVDKSSYDQIISECAAKHGLEPTLVKAVVEAESNYNPLAVSPKGAMGLMQLMPQTAGMLGVNNPFDPRQNIEAGSKYLSKLINAYDGRLDLALAAYNAGPTAVGGPPKIPQNNETPNYIQKVLRVYVAQGGVVPDVKKDQDEEKNEKKVESAKPRGVVFLCKDEEGRMVITNIPTIKGK
jgi:soluble lytic murein transglycosylase-like protein